jgi:hypothetical protein
MQIIFQGISTNCPLYLSFVIHDEELLELIVCKIGTVLHEAVMSIWQVTKENHMAKS